MISSLTAENLALKRGERMLFQDVDFRVCAGQALAIEGANGVGKTSLLRLIAGFLTEAGGSLVLKTQNAEITDGEERGRYAAWLGHQDGLKPQLTVTEQLTFFARLYRSVSDTGAVLEQVGLTRQGPLPCRYLSAGQRRRLALARLLLSGRPLWLLDEPFAALDVAGKGLVARLIALHCGDGGVVIAATHEELGLGNEVLKL